MHVLVIGGTRFVGLAITRELLSRGHEVSVFHRSDTQPLGTERAHHLQGDRDGDLSLLKDGKWDAAIDVCAYRPHQVESLAQVLKDRVKHFVFISTVSVYDEGIQSRSDESASLTSVDVLVDADSKTVDIDGVTYGPLKVLCEQAVTANFENALIIRPTYVIGPDDYTQRFSAWVQRIHQGGSVDVPLPVEAPLQYIDARDLSRFTVDKLEDGTRGVFHVATPSGGTTFGAVIQTIASTVGGENLQLNWLSVDDALTRAEEFPLWTEGEDVTILQMDTSKAEQAGLQARPLSETIADIVQQAKN